MKKTLLILIIAILAVGAVFAVDGKFTLKASCEAPIFFNIGSVNNLIYQAGVDYNFDSGVSLGIGGAIFPYEEDEVYKSITAEIQYKYSYGKYSLAANAEFLSFIGEEVRVDAADFTINVVDEVPTLLKPFVCSEFGFMAYSLNPSYKISEEFEIWGKLTYVPIFHYVGAEYFLPGCCSFGLGVAVNL